MAGTLDSDVHASNGYLTWNGTDPVGSLAALYGATIQKGQEQIKWYSKNLTGRGLARGCAAS